MRCFDVGFIRRNRLARLLAILDFWFLQDVKMAKMFRSICFQLGLCACRAGVCGRLTGLWDRSDPDRSMA